jgi:hypothetical protein
MAFSFRKRHALDGAQLGAPGARIALDLLGGGDDGFSCQDSHPLHARTPAQVARAETDAFACGELEAALDDTIFEAVKADDYKTSPRGEKINDLVEVSVKTFQLLVDGDAQGLEDLRGRMMLRASSLCGLNQLSQLLGCADALSPACVDDCRGDAPCFGFFSVRAKEIREFIHRKLVDQIGCGGGLRTIHPHVERTFFAKAEPPFGLGELEAGSAQIHQNTVHLGEIETVEQQGQVSEILVMERYPFPIGGETLLSLLEGFLVPIDGDEASVSA